MLSSPFVHIVATSSSLLARTALRKQAVHRARGELFYPSTRLSVPINYTLLTRPRNLHTTRVAMSDPSKTKSDGEWKAILNPEQVCVGCIVMPEREQVLTHPI